MSAKEKGFTPIMLSYDDLGYDKAQKKAKEKLELLDKASAWIHNAIPQVKVKIKTLHNDILEYFNDLVLSAYKEENTLGLSAEKLIDLKEIPIKELAAIAADYYKNDFEITFPDGVPSTNVDRKPFETWTVNNNQNRLLMAGKKFINACEDLSNVQSVAQFTISQATRQFILFDMRNQKYYVNPEVIKNG
tara:strand:- start:57 stop:626 length:570 start_codon:yes stop_codon:yes gene_type:complete